MSKTQTKSVRLNGAATTSQLRVPLKNGESEAEYAKEVAAAVAVLLKTVFANSKDLELDQEDLDGLYTLSDFQKRLIRLGSEDR